MDNFLLEIEKEYSRIRGRYSPLRPIDWQLAQDWEDQKVPLGVVLRAMKDVEDKFRDRQKKGELINSLSYFKQAVEKACVEYHSRQVGKSPETPAAPPIAAEDEAVETLNELARAYDCDRFDGDFKLQVRAIHSDLVDLAEKVRRENLTLSDIESALKEMAHSFVFALALSVDKPERDQIILNIVKERPNIDDDTRARLATKKLYQIWNLPELTLFRF